MEHELIFLVARSANKQDNDLVVIRDRGYLMPGSLSLCKILSCPDMSDHVPSQTPHALRPCLRDSVGNAS